MPQPIGYGRILRKVWWILLLVPSLSVMSAVFFTLRQTPVYRASATVVVTPNTQVEGTADILRSLETLERRSVIATFARLPSTRETRDAAAKRLGLSSRSLDGYRIEASVLPNTNIIKIDVEGPDSLRVAELANAVASVTKEEVRGMYRIFTLRTLAEAVPSSRPVYPDPQRNYAVAGILGVFLAAAAAFTVGRFWKPSPPRS